MFCMIKKLTGVFLAVTFVLGLAGCGSAEAPAVSSAESTAESRAMKELQPSH